MAHEDRIHIPRFRRKEGRLRWDLAVPRFWRKRDTHEFVEVVRQTVVAGTRQRNIIFLDEYEGKKVELTMPYEQFIQEHDPVGNNKLI
jgi:hypothetical protein